MLQLCPGALSPESVQSGWGFISKCRKPITNRVSAAGALENPDVKYMKEVTEEYGGHTTNTIHISNAVAKALGDSAIVGYFDRYQRTPFCRECAISRDYPKLWQQFQPLIREVDRTFRESVPDRYQIQRALADATNPAWVITDTAFSTVTVNRNFRTAAHTDGGDLPEGFGVMAYLQKGSLAGGLLVIPRYKIAVQLQHKDVILFDVHEYHGNTICTKEPGTERITMVFYYRRRMLRCGTPQDEIDRAKHFSRIRSLYDPAEIQRADKIKKETLERLQNGANVVV